MPPENVRELVDRCLDGDQSAWRWLVEQFMPSCWRKRPFDADDVMQDVCVVLVRKLHTWNGSDAESLRAWIGKIMRREAYRSGGRSRRTLKDFEDEGTGFLESLRRFEREEEHRETQDIVSVLLEQLPEREGMIVEGVLAGKTYRVLGRELAVSKDTVGNMVAAVRKRLRIIFPEGCEKSQNSARQKPRARPL